MTDHSSPKAPVGLFLSLLVLALGIAYAGTTIAQGLREFSNADRVVVMKGLAEREVMADLALWSLTYTETGNDLVVLQEKMEQKGTVILDFLKKSGIADQEISLQDVQVQDLLAQGYRTGNIEDSRYILTQSYLVRTGNIQMVDKASKNIGELIKKGIVFSSNSSTAPTYLYTKLNEAKPDMIAEATQSARQAAREFAKDSGQKVGGIKYASQGVFQILPRDQTYVLSENQQIHKILRVVSTVTFYLED